MLVENFLFKNKIYYDYRSYKAKNGKLSRALQSFINSKNRLNDMLNDP